MPARRNAIIACAVGWLTAVGVAYADYSNTNTAAVCGYMEELGMKTSGYKSLFGNSYGCLSPYKLLGEGLLPNNIAYYADGTANKITQLKLVLNVNNRSEAAQAHAELAKSAEVLVRKALNASLPQQARKAILEGKSGRWKIGKANLTITRDDWPAGKGYGLKVVID